MKYQWLEEIPNCDELGLELGIKVKSISKGKIVVGFIDEVDPDGKPISMAITRKGIGIEFEKEPSLEVLEKLDRKLQGIKREGGKDLAQEIDDLKARVNNLEAKP